MAEGEIGGGSTTDTVKNRPLPSTRAKQPQLSEYGDIATIEVGNNDKKQTFRVHKGLLSFYSGYFRAALEGSWTDSNSGVINLDIEDPLVLGRLVLWLYTNKITDESLMSNYTIIIDLWLFADRRDIPLLMNEMIDALHLDMADNWTMPTGRVSDICENTHSGSALRRMIMWSIFRTFDATLLDASGVKLWPQEALLDMLSLALTDRPASNLTKDRYKKVKMCPTYHVHEEGASCTDK